MLTLHGGNFSMTLTLSCPSNKSSYFLRIILYAKHAISDIRRPLGFHCMPWISSCLHDASMVLLQHLTCVNEFEEVLRLCDPRTKTQGVMRCDWICFDIFSLYSRLIFASVYVRERHQHIKM